MDVDQNKTWNIKLFDIYVDLFNFNYFYVDLSIFSFTALKQNYRKPIK